MDFDINAFLKENKAGVSEEEPQLITSEAEPAKQTAFDINAFLQENAVSPTPARVTKETKPSGTSFGEEVSQLGSAFVESIGRPLENMGESFESFGFTGVADALKGAITEPENYVSAGQRFMEPAPNEAQFMGFAWQYAPRAAVEQVGQAIGAIGTRAVGAAAGGAVAGPPGAIAGGFLGPAVFGAAQVIGPVAKERAMNNGREVPNNSDLVAATLTAIGSGSLDAIGAKYLPGGEKATGKFFKRVASAFVGEGLLTEAPQSVIEQVGATAGTEKGLNINVKKAVGEGLISGTSAAGLTAIVSPFSKPAENQVIRTPEQAEELDIDAKSNQEAILLMGDPADQTQNERVTKLKEIESVIANNETLMTGLEPNAPERSKLDLENRVAKKEAEKLKAEITQGAGLSETITEAEKQQIELGKQITEKPSEEKPKSSIEQINQERINLDERAKAFGAINARQFNTQNVLNENLTEEENTLLGDYANLQAKIQNLSWRDASQLSPEDFSVWQKPKFTDKATSDEELTDLGKLLSALDARGETEKANVVRKNIEGSKRKTDWTIDSWQERFDESKTQEEIDAINSDNNDWNDSVDTILDLVKQKTKSPTKVTPTAPVAEVTPAPTEVTPTIAETLTVTPEAPAITPAPVAETPAVTEAPAAEVAPVQRDVTKPEQMTPKEFRSETLFAKKARQAAKIWGKLGSLYDRLGRELTSNIFSTDNLADPSAYSGPTTMAEIANLTEDDMLNYAKAVTLIKWAEGDVAGEFRERSGSYKELIDSEADRIRKEIELYKDIPVQERTDESDSEIKKRVEEEIDDVAFAAGIRQENERNIIRSLKYAGEINKIKEDLVRLGIPVFYNKTEYVVPEIDAPSWDDHVKEIKKARRQKKPISAAAVDKYDITLPEGYTKQGDLYVYQPTPAVSETITPSEPTGKPKDKRYNPLGYDIVNVVEDVKAGKTDTPLRAINQVVEQASQLRDRVKAESQRRQQPRKRGKAAILERIARERSAGNITEQTAQALTDFVNRIREDAIGDTAISIREKGVSNFDFADNLVTFFLNQDKGNLGREVAVHEFWHGLSRFLPEAEVEQINKDYIRELGAYLKKNPWFLAFVGRYTLTPEQYEAYKFFNPKEAQTKLTPVLDERGNITKYKINFDKDNYRYIMLDEFIAEKMTDLVLGKQAIPNTFLGKLAKVFREFLALIKTKLGIDPYEKFYQLVTDTNERLTLQRESGVAPPIQIYEPQEYDYSTRRMMAVEPSGEREQIMGEKIGPLKKTPEGIIAETQAKLRERFDPTKVTEQNTTEAFRALGRLTGKDGTAFAQELNDIGRMVDESGAAAEVSMGAALFVNDLFEYAVRLAAQGDKKMLGIMMTNINKLPTGTEGRSDAGRALRAAREMKDTFLTMAKAEQDAFINYAAEFVYGPNPTKQQVDSIQIGYDAVEKVQEPTAKEVEEEIAAVGEKTGTNLVGKINDEFTKATEKGKAKRKTEIEDLDAEYKKVQMKAESEIEKLAKIQSDTPAFARQVVNEIRAIIANDLKQRPDMESKAQWKSALVDKLQNAGVEPSRAERLADLVWRQHEINNLSREIDSINKAVEKGPISEIIKAIKETPLEQQQNPNWRYEVMRDYLRKAGLSVTQAERIAKLMDISLQKRFTQAKEQAFTDAIIKTAPWKSGDVRSKRAFQQVIQAIRAGALDPSRNMASDIAAMNGWTGFTADQYKNLLKNDAILANEDSKDIQKAEAYKAIQDIISKSKLPIRARDVIGQYYDAQALSGIPTLTVNSFSPIAFAMRNAIVQAGSGTIKGDAKAIGRAATEFVDSIKSWANTVAFSFKNNVTVYSNVDYIVNDDNLLRLYRKGVDQFTKSKNAKERADGVKNMMIGMMDYVRRILNALDYGAIAALQNQNISKYAMAVMKRQKMNDKQANEMFGVMMKAKNDFYLQQIAIGTDKNKAGILADEFYISSWKEALSKAGVEKSDIQQAMDAAINDALSSVGRNRQSLDAFKEENTKMKDAGVSSMPALWLLESVANAANRSDNQVVKLFSRVIYGFAIVPARVIRETAWFSPYGFVRFGYDWTAKKMGKTSPYAQSLGTDVQYSQRLAEATAGTVALLGLMALRSGSTDDPEDEDEFKIVFTGNGPQRKDDAQFYDSWYKAGNKPNSMIVSFGKTKFTLNMMRGFEAFTWPAMMLGAIDDLEIRKKQKQQTKTPAQLEDAAIVAGFVFDAALRRGPYAFTTKSLFGTYGDIGVEGVAKGLTFPAKTLIPVLGTSLASNLSNFLNDPIDRRTLDGAVWSNIPFIGPAVAPKSLNAFGEPSLSTDLASKMFKLGVPIVYDIPTDRESIKLHELVLKQGGGPSIPTRNQLAQRLDRQPTNKEYEMFVREYGTILTKSMKKNYDKLFNAKPEFYSRAIERIGLRARDVAENKVRQAAKKP